MPLPLLVPAIIAGVSAIAGGISSASAAKKAKKAERQLQQRRDDAERRYLHEFNTDFLDTETAKSTLSSLRKGNQKQLDAANNDAVKQGTSEEAKVALAGKLNEGYSDAAARLAGFGTQYKQQLTDSHLRRLDSLDNALYNSQLNKSTAMGGITDAIGGLANAGMSAFGAGAFSKSGAQQVPNMNAPSMAINSSIPLNVDAAQSGFLNRNQDVISYGRSIPAYK